MRPIAAALDWGQQRRLWRKLRGVSQAQKTSSLLTGGSWVRNGSVDRLVILDKPTDDDNLDPEKYTESGQVSDAYLVGGGKVWYHVHWERVDVYDKAAEEWKAGYKNVKGEKVEKQPDWVSTGMLSLGFTDSDLTKPKKIPNPLVK